MKIPCNLLLIVCAHTFFPTSLLAQNYFPATIVYHGGKVENGDIYYGNWGETPQSIRFRDKKGNVQKLGVADIQSFWVTRKDGVEERYALKTVKVNTTSKNLSTLDFGPEPNMVLDTVFVQTLIEAEANLYLLNTGTQIHLFLERDSIYELIHKLYQMEASGPHKYLENNRFRQQILALTHTCPSLTEAVLRTPYTEKHIQQTLLRYLACRKATIDYTYQRKKGGAKLYLLAGAVSSSYTYASDNGLGTISRGGFGPHVSIAPGIGCAVPFPRTNGRFGAWGDVTLRQFKHPDKNRNDYDITSLRFQTGPRWTMLNRKWKVYLQPSLVVGFELKDNSNRAGSADKKWEHGFGGTLGCAYGRLGLEARFDRGNGFSPLLAFIDHTQNWSLLMTYRLN